MRWLCIDPGTRRTGVAISSPEGAFAVPLLVLEHDASGPDVNRLAELVHDHGVQGLVIGLPLYMDGSSSAQTLLAVELARRVAARLEAQLEIPAGLLSPEHYDATASAGGHDPADEPGGIRVLLWDERLSSWEAQRAREAGGATGRKSAGRKKAALDAHAAAIILQSFLDATAPAPDCVGMMDDDADGQMEP
jgi:putative Holliday junction resolvase